MDVNAAAALASLQYQSAAQAGGQNTALAQALGSATSSAAQATAFLPPPSGPAAILELSPQAQQASATYQLASFTGQGPVDVQALVQQASSVSANAQAALLPSGSPVLDPSLSEAFASYQLIQAQQTGQDATFVRSLIHGTQGPAALLNTLI